MKGKETRRVKCGLMMERIETEEVKRKTNRKIEEGEERTGKQGKRREIQ